jgi:hypothetical protein
MSLTKVTYSMIEGNFGFINASEWGVSADLTDNATQLIAMRNYMAANPTVAWTVKFEPGVYKYSNNRWTIGVVNLTIEAYDVSFQNTFTPTFGVDAKPLKTIDYMYVADQDIIGTPAASTVNSGYLINTAAVGDETITLLTPADSSNFNTSDYILIWGFDQQFSGGPPNARYFEYRKAIAINAATGVITLDTKLKNAYDADWWDAVDYSGSGTGYVGKARAKPISNPYDAITENLTIKGASFLANPNAPAPAGYDYMNLSGIMNVEFIDVNCDDINSFNATENIKVFLSGGSYRCDFELDKLTDEFKARNVRLDAADASVVYGMSAATGLNTVDIEGCVLENRVLNLTPRNLVICNNEINNSGDAPTGTNYSVISGYFSAFPYHSITINDNRIRSGITYNGDTFFATSGPSYSLTPSGASGTSIVFPADATAKNILQNLDIGQVLVRDDGLYSGTVTRIYKSSTNIIVDGTWAVTPSPANAWLFHIYRNVSVNNNSIIAGKKFAASSAYPFSSGNLNPQTEVLKINSDNFEAGGTASDANFISHALISKVLCHVSRAYTGAYADKTLYVRNVTGTPVITAIDLTTTGSRYLDLFGQTLVGSDVANSANLMTFIERLNISVPTQGTSAQQARFFLEVTITPMYA